jgi:hypothetical protein
MAKKNPHNGGLLDGLDNHEAETAADPAAHFTEALRQKLSE